MKRTVHIFSISMVFLATGVNAATLEVCSDKTYKTIAAAIAVANDGDTISICAGTYNESLSFSKSNLTFQSSTGNRSDVRITNKDKVFDIKGPNATIRDLTISSSNDEAIVTNHFATGSHTFQNLSISAKKTAIHIDNGSAHTFKELNITSDDEAILTASNATGSHTFQDITINAKNTGIHVNNGSTLTFSKINITSTNGAGIFVEYNADGGHVYDTVTVNSAKEGIVSIRGASSMKNINVTSSDDLGIRMGNKYSAVLQDITVTAKNEGLYITHVDSASASHTFTNVNIASQKKQAIRVAQSGKLTFSNVTVASQDENAIQLDFSADAPHVFSGLTVTGTGEGKTGLLASSGLASIKNANIASSGTALYIGNHYDIAIDGLVAASQKASAINFANIGGSASYSLKNITINGAGGSSGDGFAFAHANQVTAENICVNSTGRYGFNFSYNTRNVTLKNSIIKGNGSYGILLESDPSSVAHVNNNCFYKAPCASASSSSHDFRGNYWAASCNNNNVNDPAPLASCPLTANSCYVYTPPSVVPGGFNAFESGTAAGAIAGVIKTKIAGSGFSLDVVALNTAKDAVDPAFTGDVKLELLGNTTLDAALDSANCPKTSTVLSSQTITFATADAGRKKSVNVAAVANVWRDVRVRLSYPATGTSTLVACSTDNFAIRPASLVVTATDADWQTAGTARSLGNNNATGGVVHKAGRPFTLNATAFNAATTPASTSNYAGSPTVKSVACTLPTPTCTNGVVTPGTWSGTGTVTTSTATYSEAGSFNLTLEDKTFAIVDAADSSSDEYTIPATKVLIGRFVPDHFALSASGSEPQFRTFSAACTAQRFFTYIGQPFGYATVPKALVTAQNASGETTANYSTDSSKIKVTQTYASSSASLTTDLKTPEMSVWSLGQATITINSEDKLTFTRNLTAPQAPFDANISLSINVADATESGIAGQGEITAAAPLAFKGTTNSDGSSTGIAFDAGANFRYGRLRLSNAFGSERLNLPIPIRTEYWTGSYFATNTADNCTTLSLANISLRNYIPGINQTNLPASHITVGGAFREGIGTLVLNRPIAPVTSKGSVDICVHLGSSSATACTAGSAGPTWLQGRWSQTNFNEDPVSRATFGIYKGGPIIYMREVY